MSTMALLAFAAAGWIMYLIGSWLVVTRGSQRVGFTIFRLGAIGVVMGLLVLLALSWYDGSIDRFLDHWGMFTTAGFGCAALLGVGALGSSSTGTPGADMTVAKRAMLGAVLFGFPIALVFWNIVPSPGGEVSTAVGREVREKRASTVNFSQLTGFSWTEMFIFGPYEDRKDMCLALGLSGVRCRWIVPSSIGEGECFLVFRDHSEVVHYEYHARRNGDFYRPPRPVQRDNSTFSVSQDNQFSSGYLWYFLKHEPRSPGSR
jgi:hypothetical protein